MSLFDRLQDRDKKNEVRILWSELAIIAILAFVMAVYFTVS
jgi:hypothetical protein